MKAYKGFNRDMKCRDFQFEEGRTYETETASLCNSGFHACENPLDCFHYYSPGQSVFHVVELEGVSEERQDDSKVCGTKITIGAELSTDDIVKAHFEYVTSRCAKVEGSAAGDNEAVSVKEKQSCSAGNCGSASAGEHGSASAGECGSASAGECGSASAGECGSASAGECGSASAGYYGSASAGECGSASAGYYGSASAGYYGSASAGEYGSASAGKYGSAVSRGSVSVGENGTGLVRGNGVKIRGGLGALLVIAEEKADGFDVAAWKAFRVDGNRIKADAWYMIKNNELVEVTDAE